MSILNLIVLRCSNLDRAAEFYQCLGLRFEQQRHGEGPQHLAAIDESGTVFELYAASENSPVDRCTLGLGVNDLDSTSKLLRDHGFEPGKILENPWGLTFVVRDPDNRRVEVKLQTN